MNWCSLTPALKQSLSVLGTLFHLPSQSNKGWISEHKSISSVFFSTPASGLTEVSPWNCQTTNTKRGTILILTIFLPRDYKAHPLSGPVKTSFQCRYWKTSFHSVVEAGNFLHHLPLPLSWGLHFPLTRVIKGIERGLCFLLPLNCPSRSTHCMVLISCFFPDISVLDLHRYYDTRNSDNNLFCNSTRAKNNCLLCFLIC